MRRRAEQLARWLWGADGDEGFLTLLRSTPVVLVIVSVTVVISTLDFMLPEWRAGVGAMSHYLGSSAAWVAHGQWWRLLTGGFVNPPCPGTPSCTGWEHLYGTMIPVGLIGLRVEKTLGSRRFLLLYLMVTFAAFLPSQLFFQPDWGYGGGSSGGSHGLYGAILVIAFAERSVSRGKRIYFFIATVALVLHMTRNFVRSDFHNSMAHLGALVVGALLVAIWTWGPRSVPRLGSAIATALVVFASIAVAVRAVDLRQTDDAVVGSVALGMEPALVTSAFGSLWVTGNNASELVRVDPTQGKVVARIPVGKWAGGMVAANDRLWVVADHGLLEVDHEANRATPRVKLPEGDGFGVAVADGSLWVTLQRRGEVLRIDPKRYRIVETIKVGGAPGRVIAVGGHLWISSVPTNKVIRIDPTNTAHQRATNVDSAYWMEQLGGEIVVGAGSELVRIDPRSTRPTNLAMQDGRIYGFTIDGDGRVWSTLTSAFAVSVFDPRTRGNRRVRIGLGEGGGIAFADKVWVTDWPRRQLLRVDPSRV